MIHWKREGEVLRHGLSLGWTRGPILYLQWPYRDGVTRLRARLQWHTWRSGIELYTIPWSQLPQGYYRGTAQPWSPIYHDAEHYSPLTDLTRAGLEDASLARRS